MALYTITLYNWLQNGFSLPAVFDTVPDISGMNFKTLFTYHFSDWEIGFETEEAFSRKLEAHANMIVRTDLRGGSITNITVENGAYFIFDGISKILTDGSTADIILNNALENGAILFNEKILASTDVVYDADNNVFNVIVATTERTETYAFQGAEGVDLSDVVWTDTLVDGYWALTAMQAVPEPAEWAMIFGGLAFGLAVYKRRKA